MDKVRLVSVSAAGAVCKLNLESKYYSRGALVAELTPAQARELAAELVEVAKAASIKVGDEVYFTNDEHTKRGIVVASSAGGCWYVHFIGHTCSHIVSPADLVKVR